MTNSIDYIMKYTIQIGPNFISLKFEKNIACVCKKADKLEQKKVHVGPTQKCWKRREAQFELLSPLGVKELTHIAISDVLQAEERNPRAVRIMAEKT